MKTGFFKNILLVLLLIPVALVAQPSKANKRLAKELYKYGDYRDAQILYKEMVEAEPDNAEYLTRYGICCFHSDHRRDALPFLLRAKDKNYTGDRIDYYLGKVYHLNHEFDKAIENFEAAKKVLDLAKDQEEIKNLNHQIQMCKYGKELVKAPVKVQIVNLGSYVNSPNPDFVPIVSSDETTMIFTSRRPNTTGGQIEEATHHYYEDIYISHREEGGEWREPAHMDHNSSGHDACVSISHQGNKLFIYKHENQGDIFMSTLKGEKWSKPVAMPAGINTKYGETSLSMTPDEKVIFFSSDRPGGFGGFDIYYAVRTGENSWSQPVNAGPIINTEYDEDAPFAHADGKTLYFSSKSHNSMGGYDIFTSHYNIKQNSFGAPVNVGYPINTADDDIFFVWSPDGTRAYFSSFREEGYGEKDLYMLTREVPKAAVIAFKGRIHTDPNEKSVPAIVRVYDNETNELVQEFETNSATGKFLVLLPPGRNYQIAIEEVGYLPYSENVAIPDKDEFFDIEKDIYMQKLKPGSMANLKNVFFDLNKATIRKESHIELERFVKFLKEHPDMYFEIAGHTDSISTNQYNYKLSESRAKAVVEYLTEKGVNKAQIFPVGYGEDFFVAPNSTEDGRQLNRRTEVIVIEKPKTASYTRKEGFYSTKK